ncbi:hypothetical protein KSP40_PGU021985 [Platanthera guangdongensis]|uniref:Uncharacterized protein n=1 Tax=Platanthera guangdongensis TaxID=2320717 RepID=A0ABR2M635_9ASPA
MSPLLLLPLLLSAASLEAAAIVASEKISISTDNISSTHPLSVYEALKSYNFPIGILPIGALGYSLDRSTGDFSVYFKERCSFSLEGSYQLRYQPTVTGRISTNRLSNLVGVSVKVLLFWINIIEVVRNGDELEFSVGIASADFSIDNFYICPQCGCGLNCGTVSNLSEEADLVKLDSAI